MGWSTMRVLLYSARLRPSGEASSFSERVGRILEKAPDCLLVAVI